MYLQSTFSFLLTGSYAMVHSIAPFSSLAKGVHRQCVVLGGGPAGHGTSPCLLRAAPGWSRTTPKTLTHSWDRAIPHGFPCTKFLLSKIRKSFANAGDGRQPTLWNNFKRDIKMRAIIENFVRHALNVNQLLKQHYDDAPRKINPRSCKGICGQKFQCCMRMTSRFVSDEQKDH